MSIVKIVYLYCDGPNCRGEEAIEIHNNEAQSERNKLHEKEGWHINMPGGQDFCPDCWPYVKGTRDLPGGRLA